MAAESLEREIRDLRALLFSERDPEGRGFAPLADALRRAGDLGQAAELVREGVERLPEFSTGHVVAGWVHRARGEPAEAEGSFRRVLALDGDNVSALRGLGFLLADRGEDAEAREVFLRLDDLEPGDPEVAARLLELAEEHEPVSAWAEPPAGEPATGSPSATPSPSLVDEGPAEVLEDEAGFPEADRDVVPIRSLAPDGGGRPELAIEALAPGGTASEPGWGGPSATGTRPLVEVADLAPSGSSGSAEAGAAAAAELEPPGPAPVVDVADLAPATDAAEPAAPEATAPEPATTVEAPAPPAPSDADPDDAPGAAGPWTRTMAELYVSQGHTGRAARVYRHLLEQAPDDEDLRARLQELEEGTPPPPPVSPSVVGVGEREADIEDLARDIAAGPASPRGPEGPSAWGGNPATDEPTEAPDPPVLEYFQALLGWTPGDGDGGGEEEGP